MPRRTSDDTFPSILEPFTGFEIGLWDSDVEGGCIRGDAAMARIFSIPSAEAAQGISIERLLSIFHPDDLASDTVRRRKVIEDGGSFMWEHRIIPEPGIVRWVLSRGYFERDTDGLMHGRGIIIDVTDTRVEGALDGAPRFLTTPNVIGSPAERMAEHALELWALKHELGADVAARLQPVLESVLLELGREIASTLPEGCETPASPPKSGLKLH